MMLVLNDEEATRYVLLEQMKARMTGTCSVCEAPTGPDEMDASARCLDCAP